jgi:hypothetical protein
LLETRLQRFQPPRQTFQLLAAGRAGLRLRGTARGKQGQAQ